MDNNDTQKIPEQNVKNLLMLLDGALRYTQFVKRGIEQDDVKLRNENVGKAITILSQLDAALDKSVG
ncbi:Flagellar protein fliS, partial [Candidatus Magnetomorum sp. HK-1]